jgi:hypothetical protein
LRLWLLCYFVALRTELHERASFGVEAGDVTIDDRLPDDAEGGPGTKVVFVVELMHHLHDVVERKAGVLDVGHLVAAAVFHLLISDKTIFLDELEKLGAGKGMGDGDLNGLAIELLGELYGVAYGSPGFTGKAEDEITMYDEAKVMTVLFEVAGALNGGTLLDVLENLRIAGLEADDQQPAASFLHGLEGVIVGGDPGVAGPGEAEGFEFSAKLNGTGLLDIESIVVKKNSLT